MPKLLDQTQYDAVFALLEGIKEAANGGDLNGCIRLANASQNVMTNIPVKDELPKYSPITGE